MCTRHLISKFKHLFMVSARFCEIYVSLQVLLYTFNAVLMLKILHHITVIV